MLNNCEIKKLTSYKNLHLWDHERTMTWLMMSCADLKIYEQEFKKHQIDGRTLLQLSDKKLRQIGVVSSKDRDFIMYQVMKLRIKMRAYEIDKLDTNYESTDGSNPSLNE